MTMKDFSDYKRKSDMMCTFHSVLRDKFHTREIIANILIWVSSIILCSLTFSKESFLQELFGFNGSQSFAIGLFSLINFGISILMLLFKWQEKSAQHSDSFKYFFEVKSLIVTYQRLGVTNSSLENLIEDKYNSAPKYCIDIPDSLFLSLKRTYETKVVLSKNISIHPFVPIWIWKLKLMCIDLKSSLFS